MKIFVIVFAAVLAALYVRRELDGYKTARARHREYCHKQGIIYTWMWRIQVLAGQDSSLYKQQALYWEKQSRSWIPTSPTQSEQDLLVEQSQDDEIRQLKKDFDAWPEEPR